MASDERRDDVDDDLFEEVRGVIADPEPVPPEALVAAREAWTWRRIDAELAELVADSAAGAGVLVRGGESSRLLSFEVADVGIDVEVTSSPAGRRMIGQVMPGGGGRLVVRRAADSITVPVDDAGRFQVDAVPPGPVSLRWESPDLASGAVETAWTTL